MKKTRSNINSNSANLKSRYNSRKPAAHRQPTLWNAPDAALQTSLQGRGAFPSWQVLWVPGGLWTAVQTAGINGGHKMCINRLPGRLPKPSCAGIWDFLIFRPISRNSGTRMSRKARNEPGWRIEGGFVRASQPMPEYLENPYGGARREVIFRAGGSQLM